MSQSCHNTDCDKPVKFNCSICNVSYCGQSCFDLICGKKRNRVDNNNNNNDESDLKTCGC